MRPLSAFASDVEAAVLAGMRDAQAAALKAAIARSSGPYSSAMLAKADHPYARRHGSPRLDPSTVNVQTGSFRAAWRATSLVGAGGDLSFTVRNDDRSADFLKDGTRTMFARPIADAVEADAAPAMERALERRLEAAFKQTYR